MYPVRLWSVRHARGLERFYRWFAAHAPRLAPLLRWLGPRRGEALLYPVERTLKRFLFDCQECGQCVLSQTGMACPMNCPKQMRNGPCGGVRADGGCEVDATMRCVWVEAVKGSARMRNGRRAIALIQPPLDRRLEGRSSWLAVARAAAAQRAARGRIARTEARAR